MRQPIDLERSYLLLNHGPTVLVTSAFDGIRNVMAASWSMPLDFSPPKVAVVVDKTTLTRTLIDQAQSFALNVPLADLANAVKVTGHASGRDSDKFQDLGLETFVGDKVEAPLIAGCVGWLECRILPERHIEKTYDLFIAEVVAASADDEYFDANRWRMPDGRPRTLHYIAGGAFFETGRDFDIA